MARVTDDDVKEIFTTTLTDLSMFITPANMLVNEVLSTSGLSEAHLKEIEKWMAAHFACIQDPRVASEKIGDTQITYMGAAQQYSNISKEPLGFNSTTYGQQALLLDTTGLLRELGRKAATFEVFQ